jgi:7-cyano-7-deazaguanine synthase
MRLLLLSGGLDSAALAAWIKPDVALTIDYGQLPAEAEIRSSRNVCRELGVSSHEVLTIDCSPIGSGLLAGTESESISPCPEWWPFRNQLLVTFAAAWGVEHGATEIYTGSLASDSRHIDGTREFYERLDGLVSLQEGDMRVLTPAIEMSGATLIEQSGVTDAVLAWTHSCHRSNYACAACPGCAKRREILLATGKLR